MLAQSAVWAHWGSARARIQLARETTLVVIGMEMAQEVLICLVGAACEAVNYEWRSFDALEWS